MLLRTKCLCEGELIGIESIFTAVNGKQINIPDRVEGLKRLGRENKLFCPCGCGQNLTVVAGDRGLRRQHFRIRPGSGNRENCKVICEGEESLQTKIILKCWLEDKLRKTDLRCEVPINTICETTRKYEYTVYDPENKVGIVYWRDRANVTDEKIGELDTSSNHEIYVVGTSNQGSTGQYPEYMIKIQKPQGFCLYVDIFDERTNYESARMEAKVYSTDIDGEWVEIEIAGGFLTEFDISTDGIVSYNGSGIDELCKQRLSVFESEKIKILEQRKKEAEERARKEIEEQKRQEERMARWRAEQEERDQRERQRRADEQKKQAEVEEKRKVEKLAAEEERKRQELAFEEKRKQEWEKFEQELDELLNQQEEQVIDPDGKRLIKCEFCGKVGGTGLFPSYGGTGRVNIGRCYECDKKGLGKERIISVDEQNRKKYRPDICPECGGQLVNRTGMYGNFVGCYNFPRCRYNRKGRI